ncbi:putative secretory lipase [Aspergillus thermomutatus]|uniref:Secretory lipase n=1 Tax=Aspergillus thermomutatus TaxID=41047 RepID=A0A397HKM9_ASPTH|nr:uncharacterized protein CDV56_103514 [Aspergillus thermomutatus]RHZ62538.1 hypothetical protein CDV56_103514 [Aspergillus thermomutatus]
MHWATPIWIVSFSLGVFPLPTARDALLHPVEDPFYSAPDGFESTPPGTILRWRNPPHPISAFGFAPINLAASYQLLYRSTDSFGEAIAAASTILVPHHADYTKLLSFQVAEDAANRNCAPSYAFQLEAATDGELGLLMPQAELALIIAALDKGWVVTVPDHLGPNATFLANNLSGHAVLDNIRAALRSSAFTKVSPQATVTLWGYSGGSLASGFAAERQPSYAPELSIAGAALGGTVPHIMPVFNSINKGIWAGLIPAGMQGLANEYPVIERVLYDHLVPAKKADFVRTKELCFIGDQFKYQFQDIYSYFTDANMLNDPDVARVLGANAMGHHVPDAPLFIYKSANDEVSPVGDTDALVSSYCGAGAKVEYHRDEWSNHATMAVIGAPDALLWLQDRMNGVPVHAGCRTKTVLTRLMDPRALSVLGINVIKILLALLSAPVGTVVIG